MPSNIRVNSKQQPRKSTTETVRLPQDLVQSYRGWSQQSGRSLSGLMELVLRQALSIYNDGWQAAYIANEKRNGNL